ncbi:MAG: hypothetical protein KIT72_04905 [Polyangiaceae bacterium]|nr:hypothetical protein [Polyangiaceae bacterium]MCW5789743.1 hypothetical protein [Polyangiaceae bacterium]
MSAVLTDLLRDPARVAERAERAEGLRDLALTSLACVTLGAGSFGGVLGAFRGGAQIAYAALKLPLALLITLVVCVPAFYALAAGFGATRRFATIAALSLAASARAALVLLACAPVLWLALDRQLSYHAAVMLAATMYMAAGLAAVTVVVRGLGSSLRALATSAACGLVFFAVLGQTAWGMRPFVGRPSAEHVPLFRAREGSFADSLVESSRSALSRSVRSSLTERGGHTRRAPQPKETRPVHEHASPYAPNDVSRSEAPAHHEGAEREPEQGNVTPASTVDAPAGFDTSTDDTAPHGGDHP